MNKSFIAELILLGRQVKKYMGISFADLIKTGKNFLTESAENTSVRPTKEIEQGMSCGQSTNSGCNGCAAQNFCSAQSTSQSTSAFCSDQLDRPIRRFPCGVSVGLSSRIL